MSIETDKFLAFRINILEEYQELRKKNTLKPSDDKVWEIYISGEFNDEIPKKVIDAGFKTYYPWPHLPQKDNITMLYDGITQKYAYLLYIINAEYDTYNEDEENVVINNALKCAPVPEEVKQKMHICYEEIFGKPCEKEIYLQEVLHWH